MIYFKRTLWLLGYPIMWTLSCMLFIVVLTLIGFECMFLYIKNGNMQGCDNLLEWCVNCIEWYNNIEPKED